MIKVDVISGFLGAGKTTLIKKLFETVLKNEKVVLIENEFGEIGIDGSFLKEAGINIKEINSGCICCSLVGDFSLSIKEVIDKFNPERIIIEPSGVGKLSDIVEAIKKVDAPLELNILTTVVDGTKAKVYLKNFGEFFIDQVESANTIIVSKTDKMTEEKIIDCVELLKNKNNDALIITTPIKELESEKIVKTLEENKNIRIKFMEEMINEHHHEEHHHGEECCCGHHHEEHHHGEECCCGHHHEDHHHDEECCCGHHHEHHHQDEECCCGHHHEEHHHGEECCCGHHHEDHHHDEECCCGHHHEHHHHADEVFVSWGIETPLSYTYDNLTKILDNLSNVDGMVLRSKGILKASDNNQWYYFDYVAGDYEIRLGNPDVIGRICVIGSKIDLHEVENLFRNR